MLLDTTMCVMMIKACSILDIWCWTLLHYSGYLLGSNEL